MQVIEEQQIRDVVSEAAALESAVQAFRALGNGHAIVPPPVSLNIDRHGELHIKCAYLRGSRFFVVKAASGFYENPQRGLPSGSGLMLVFDAATGFPVVLLQDNGYLTELRTAAAGALAAQHLAVPSFQTLAMIGAGTQCRYQLRALRQVLHWTDTCIWSRNPEGAQRACQEMSRELNIRCRTSSSVEAAVRAAALVVTVTPSRTALVRAEWLATGATVIAVGSDEPDKQELHADVLLRADKVVVDSLAQCATRGELHHALKTHQLTQADVHAEVGEIVTGNKPGREGNELIVCDLTGVGAQDAAIAELAWRKLQPTILEQ